MPTERLFLLKTEYITLGQFLKAADVVSSGGEAKEMIAAGGLVVNGEPEARRGRKLRIDDIVTLLDGNTIKIAAK